MTQVPDKKTITTMYVIGSSCGYLLRLNDTIPEITDEPLFAERYTLEQAQRVASKLEQQELLRGISITPIVFRSAADEETS